MPKRSFFAPTKPKCVAFAVVVALQLVAAPVGLGCGWSLIHGADVALATVCVVIAGALLLPSAVLSSGFLPLPLPYALFGAVSIALNGLWAWVLAGSVARLWARRRSVDRPGDS